MLHSFNNRKTVLGGRYGIVFLVFVVCLLFGGIWRYQLEEGRTQAIQAAKNKSASLVRIMEEANIRTLQAVDLTLINVGVCVRLQQWNGEVDPRSYLRTLLGEAPQIREVAFADPRGNIVSTSRRGSVEELSIAKEDYFLMARDGTLPPLYISKPKPGRMLGDNTGNGLYHIVMARPVLDESGAFRGVALAVINPGYFHEQFYGLDVGESGFVALYRYDGKLLVANTPEKVDSNRLSHLSGAVFNDHLPSKEWGTFLQDGKDTSSAYIMSYRATTRWPALVVVGVEQEEVLAVWRQEATKFSLLMGCSLLVLAGMAAVVFRQHVMQERLAQKLFEAHHDDLTGIPSLRLCLDRLANALARARRNRDVLGVFFVDLDGFKEVNDNYGHEAGDHVLKTVAERLTGCVREMDTVGRLGGDEFLIIFPKLQGLLAAEKIAGSVLESLRLPVAWKGSTVQVSASVGIALYPQDGKDTEQLIQKADKAMYRAKKHGKNQFAHTGGP